MGLFNFGKKSTPGEVQDTSPTAGTNVPLCMWKSTKQDPDFQKSEIVKLIDQMVEYSEGNELTFFNGTVGLGGGGKPIKKIPEEEIRYGPLMIVDVPFVISLSKDKGLRFHFDYDYSGPEKIKHFLSEILKLMRTNPAVLQRKKLNEPTNGKQWWQMTKQVLKMKNLKEAAVGQISFPIKTPS